MHKYIFLICLLLVSLNTSRVLAAESGSPSLLAAIKQQLVVEQLRCDFIAQKLNKLQQSYQAFTVQPIALHPPLSQAEAALAIAQTEYENIHLNFKTAQLELELAQQAVQSLKRRTSLIFGKIQTDPNIAQTLQEQQNLLELQQKRIRVFQKAEDLSRQIVTITKSWYTQLQKANQQLIQSQWQINIDALAEQLKETQHAWLTQLNELNNQLQASSEENLTSLENSVQIALPFNAILAEEKSNLIHIKLNLTTVRNQLKAIHSALQDDSSLSILTSFQGSLENLIRQLQTVETLIKKKCEFIHRHNTQSKDRKITEALQALNLAYHVQLKQARQLIEQAEVYSYHFNQQLHEQLAKRQNFPGLDVKEWTELADKMMDMYDLVISNLKGVCQLCFVKVREAVWWRWLMSAITLLVWSLCFVKVKDFFSSYFSKLSEKQTLLPESIVSGLFRILRKCLLNFTLLISIASFLRLMNVPFSAFSHLLSLGAVSLFFGITLQLSKLFLLENQQESNGHDVNLYYRLRWILNVGRIFTVLSLISNQLGASYAVREFLSRLFMLFLLAIALVLLKNWRLLPHLLQTYLVQKPNYLKQVIRLISFFLPASLLLNAICGLIGYVQLAWRLGFHQILFLLALVIYLLIKGGLDEMLLKLSEQSIRRFRNGWLWSEALLKPLHQWLKLLTFLSIVIVLFTLASWNKQLLVFNIDFYTLFSRNLLVILETPITIWVLIKVGIASSILVWLTHWTREFAYRWLFAELKDLGLRNSLSVITQYTAISIGIAFLLYVAGVTLTVLKYVLTGFSVGIGFGLRDIFNNFVTGILLLLERPLKIGDWVTVGEHEGQVIYLGARSITVNTDDHKELIVPNIELFNKQFVNWTHHDSVVRVTLPISVNRKDNPFKVRELILEVIASIPKILNQPRPEVYFKETAQVLLEFTIEYYVDISQIVSRSDVRSQFLFALWNRFYEEQILPPENELSVKGKFKNLEEVIP